MRITYCLPTQKLSVTLTPLPGRSHPCKSLQSAASLLHSVLPQVGRPPKGDALNIYLMRLREQGWNLEPTIRRIKECGGNLDPHVQGELRL